MKPVHICNHTLPWGISVSRRKRSRQQPVHGAVTIPQPSQISIHPIPSHCNQRPPSTVFTFSKQSNVNENSQIISLNRPHSQNQHVKNARTISDPYIDLIRARSIHNKQIKYVEIENSHLSKASHWTQKITRRNAQTVLRYSHGSGDEFKRCDTGSIPHTERISHLR